MPVTGSRKDVSCFGHASVADVWIFVMRIVTVFVTITDEHIRNALLFIASTLEGSRFTVGSFDFSNASIELINEVFWIDLLCFVEFRLQFFNDAFESDDKESVGGQSRVELVAEQSAEGATRLRRRIGQNQPRQG